MFKKNPTDARMAAEQERAEIKKLVAEINGCLIKVPQRVVNGSHNEAVAYKKAVAKGLMVSNTPRPALNAVRQVAAELARFYT